MMTDLMVKMGNHIYSSSVVKIILSIGLMELIMLGVKRKLSEKGLTSFLLELELYLAKQLLLQKN